MEVILRRIRQEYEEEERLTRVLLSHSLDLDQASLRGPSGTLAAMPRYDWMYLFGMATLIASVGGLCVILFTL